MTPLHLLSFPITLLVTHISLSLSRSHPVKVVEGGSELIELLLADALGITGQDLVLNLVNGAGDGGEELLPAHTNMLQTQTGKGER